MRVTRQPALVLLSLTLCYTALLGSISPALGADSEANGPSPTVSFSDTSTLDLSKESLEALAREGGLDVKVHNGLGRAQLVSLEATGLDSPDEPALAGLFAKSRDSQRASAGGTATLRLVLTDPLPDIEEGVYAATLIAFGSRGGLARRELTITYSTTSGGTETPGENSLNPARPIDITLRAVNYLPSLLSNLLALGVFLTIALVTIALLFKERLNTLGERLPGPTRMQNGGPFKLLIAFAVVSGVLTLYGLLEDGSWDSPSFHAISSRPIDLAPSVPSGTRGTVSSEDGLIAQLIASEGKLRPENLNGAGKYVGKYNLGGEVEKTGAAATVTIRDYWIYAVIVITLGLLVGFALNRWFQEQRPKAKLRTRLERLRHNYDADISGSQASYEGGPFKDVRIDGRLLSREGEINSLLDAGETSPATEKLLALGIYLDRFATLREKRRNLENAVAELERVDRSQLNLDLADASGYQVARRLLEQAEDPTGLDSDEVELKAEITRVDELTQLIEGTSDQIKNSNRWLKAAASLKEECEGDQLGELGAAQKALKEAGQSALQAIVLADLSKARETGNAAVRNLVALIRLVQGKDAPAMRNVESDPAILRVEPFDAIATAEDIALTVNPPDVSGVKAQISWTVLNADDSGLIKVHLEDYVQFTIKFEAETQPPFPQVEIDFGEGIPVKYNMPRLDKPLIVTHRYRTLPERPIVVSAAPGGGKLKQIEHPEVDPEARILPSQLELARTDRVVEKAAFVLAVGSGLVALYFTDTAWGQPMDYLAAFLWGGATGEGVKLAAGLVDRVWPAP